MEGENLLNLIEKLEPGIVVFDDEFSVSYLNRASLLIFAGVSREEIFSGNILDLHKEPVREKIREMFRLMKDSSRQIPFSFKRISDDNRDRYLFVKLIPLLDRQLADSLSCLLVYDVSPYITSPQRRFIKIPVTSGSEIRLIDPADITYLKAENIYSRVHTDEGDYFSDLSLGFIEERLPRDRFFRIHRSYIVNLDKVRKVVRERRGPSLLIAGGETRLPVSQNRASDFFAKLGLK